MISASVFLSLSYPEWKVHKGKTMDSADVHVFTAFLPQMRITQGFKVIVGSLEN